MFALYSDEILFHERKEVTNFISKLAELNRYVNCID